MMCAVAWLTYYLIQSSISPQGGYSQELHLGQGGLQEDAGPAWRKSEVHCHWLCSNPKGGLEVLSKCLRMSCV